MLKKILKKILLAPLKFTYGVVSGAIGAAFGAIGGFADGFKEGLKTTYGLTTPKNFALAFTAWTLPLALAPLTGFLSLLLLPPVIQLAGALVGGAAGLLVGATVGAYDGAKNGLAAGLTAGFKIALNRSLPHVFSPGKLVEDIRGQRIERKMAKLQKQGLPTFTYLPQQPSSSQSGAPLSPTASTASPTPTPPKKRTRASSKPPIIGNPNPSFFNSQIAARFNQNTPQNELDTYVNQIKTSIQNAGWSFQDADLNTRKSKGILGQAELSAGNKKERVDFHVNGSMSTPAFSEASMEAMLKSHLASGSNETPIIKVNNEHVQKVIDLCKKNGITDCSINEIDYKLSLVSTHAPPKP